MMENATDLLFSLVGELREAKISFSLEAVRDDAITILAAVPGQRWELDIFRNGDVEFEVFRSGGEILDLRQVRQMIRTFAD